MHPEQQDKLSGEWSGLFSHDYPVNLDSGGVAGAWPSRDLNPLEGTLAGYLPSAIQIRRGGAKGMLALDPSLPGHQAILRDSMIKFDCKPFKGVDTDLAIVGVSAPAKPAPLTSETIYLFEGVCSQKAKLVEYLSEWLFDKRLDNHGSSLQTLVKEPRAFLSTLGLPPVDHLFESSAFVDHILRLHCLLPQSATLYGVADHVGLLQSDEIFLQITTPHGKVRYIFHLCPLN